MRRLGRRVDRATLIDAVRTLPPGLRFVGIDGFGAAGKTSLAVAVATAVPRVVVVHVDDFQGVGVTEWDWDRLAREVVEPLRSGRDAHYAIWSWGEPEPDGHGDVAAGSVVVIEGVSATRREAAVPWDLTVWVDAPEPVRRRRALDRDGPGVQRIWHEHWLPPERAYGERERPWERVDFVIEGAPSAGPAADGP